MNPENLEEVDRLRAEVAGYRSAICFETTCTGCAGMLDQLAQAEAEVDRLRAENTAQASKIAEAQYLADGWVRAGSGWSSLNMTQAAKYRALIDCGKALSRALEVGDSSDPSALDQSGEGQANADR